jgi:ATP-binding cassette, subfamily B, bacterial
MDPPNRTGAGRDSATEVGRGTLRRVVARLRPYRGRACAVGAVIVASALLNLAPPLFVKRIVDEAIPQRRVGLLLALCGGMVVGPLLAGLLQVGQRYLATAVGEGVMLDLRLELFRHLHRQPLRYFADAPPGEVISHVLNDVQGVGSVVSGTMVRVVESAVVFASPTALVLSLDWRLGLVALGLLPLFVLPTRSVGRRRKLLKRQAQRTLAELTGMLTETLCVSGALLLKIFSAEQHEERRLAAKSTELRELSIRQSLLGRWFQMLLGLFETGGPALVFAAGGLLVMQGHVRLGTVIAFVTVLKRLYGSVSQLAGVHVDVVTSFAYFDRVFGVLDTPPGVAERPGATILRQPRGAVWFRGVSFAYGGTPCLRDVTLSVEPGQTVGIVGPSGAGKSTLAALLPRLADPTAGQVLLDGRDLRDLTLASLRSHIAVVTQDTFLLHATLEENLRYGRPDASFDEIVAAARAAQVHDVIAALPDGYHTVVGERGQRLSGGERQRIALARAILKNPRVLVLDEATSALDAKNEALVQEALGPLLRGRTSFIIAHRLAAVRDADLIVVLDGGRLVEQGTHAELLRGGGLYARLDATQRGEPAPQDGRQPRTTIIAA